MLGEFSCNEWRKQNDSAAPKVDCLVVGVQFQSMLWRLLGHALDLSNPESDTLVEEALRLLVSVLNSTTAFMPALQVYEAH